MTNNIIPHLETPHVTWNITINQDSTLDLFFFEDKTLKPLDISKWKFVASFYNDKNHSFVDLDYEVNGNILTLNSPEEHSPVLKEGSNPAFPFVRLEVQGFNEKFNFESPENPDDTFVLIMGDVLITDVTP